MTDIDEVKSRLNIVDIIGSRVSLKKAGRHFKALCPFHNEKTPSFIVSPERQMWKCFGCGRGGSVIDFVMEYEHVDFVEALTDLAEKAGVKLTRRVPESPEGALKQKIYEANHLSSEFYHYLLTKHSHGEKARQYLKNRGISDKSIETFGLGYRPNSWDGLLKFLKKKGYETTLLEQAGLIISSPRGGYDRFRGRIMFTLKDHRGNVVGFSGRLLDSEAKEAKYINTSETPVYSKSNVLYGFDVTRDAITRANEAILMEGEFDVISSFQAGISNVVAIKGSALTEGHVNLLKRFTDRLIFALDSDLAGDSAARRGIEIADRAGLDLKVTSMPTGKDPDEAVRENPGLFKKAIKDAVPVYDYFIASATRRFDAGSAYGKKKIGEELLPIIANIENSIVQGHYVKKLASTLNVSEEVIEEGMKKTVSREQHVYRPQKEKSQSTVEALSRREKLELYILALLLQGKTTEQCEEFSETFTAKDFSTPSVRDIMAHLVTFLKAHRVFLIKDFADSLPKELLPTLDSAFLWDISTLATDQELLAKEWTKVLSLLKREMLREKMSGIATEIELGEKANEASLQQALKETTGELKDLEKTI